MADLNFVYATAARNHGMTMRIMTPRSSIPDMDERIKAGQKVGVMFGRERTGLISDHVALCGAKITIPLNPEFMSLNLAQAVLLIGYEWYQAHDSSPQARLEMGDGRPANREEYANFFARLEGELENHGFFVAREMRPGMVRSLQSMLQRAEMTEQEIRTWHGVISALIKEPGPKRPKRPRTNEKIPRCLGKSVAREPDRIRVFLNDCRVELSVGYHPAERLKPQPLIIDLEVEALLPHRYQDTSENSLDRIIDYERFHDFIYNELPKLGHIPLLETVAEQIVSFPGRFEDCRVHKVKVRLEKPEIYKGRARVGIEIIRTRPAGIQS